MSSVHRLVDTVRTLLETNSKKIHVKFGPQDRFVAILYGLIDISKIDISKIACLLDRQNKTNGGIVLWNSGWSLQQQQDRIEHLVFFLSDIDEQILEEGIRKIKGAFHGKKW